MSTAKCLNCGLSIPEGNEFCKYCNADLDEMVDNKELNSHDEVEVRGNVNPFFSNTRMTGNVVSSEDGLGSSMSDEEDTSSYFNALLLILVIMALMIAVFL